MLPLCVFALLLVVAPAATSSEPAVNKHIETPHTPWHPTPVAVLADVNLTLQAEAAVYSTGLSGFCSYNYTIKPLNGTPKLALFASSVWQQAVAGDSKLQSLHEAVCTSDGACSGVYAVQDSQAELVLLLSAVGDSPAQIELLLQGKNSHKICEQPCFTPVTAFRRR